MNRPARHLTPEQLRILALVPDVGDELHRWTAVRHYLHSRALSGLVRRGVLEVTPKGWRRIDDRPSVPLSHEQVRALRCWGVGEFVDEDMRIGRGISLVTLRALARKGFYVRVGKVFQRIR